MVAKNDRVIDVTFRMVIRAIDEDQDCEEWDYREIENDELCDFVETIEDTFNSADVVREIMAGSDCFVSVVNSSVSNWKEIE